MNERSRKTVIKRIAIAGSSMAAMSIVLFGGIQSIGGMMLLAVVAGTLGHIVFTGLGYLLMRLEKRLTRGRRGDFVYAFGKMPSEEGSAAGGKARVLAGLFQKGFPVPDGCILLPGAFAGDAITGEAWEKVQGQLARLRRGKTTAFAVRSSALSEDSAQASFAGEFESVLDVSSDEEIRAAVHAVHESRHSPRVQSYSQAKGLGADEHRIALIIQKLVHPDYSGVLFTADPLTGNLMQMTGNFVAGMGDKLVSGSVSAAAFTLKRTEGTYNGPDELQRIAKTLHREAHEIEHTMGSPQDIEWAVAGGKLFILQSRPITTLNGYNPVTAETNDTLKGNFLWSATNLMEACPEVLTPFTASLLPYLDQRDGPALTVKNYPLNGVIGGRFYANISVQITAFVRMFKGDTRRAYREMAGWWGEIPEELEIPLLPLTKQEWQRILLPSLWHTTRQFNKYRKAAPEFLRQNRRMCAEMRDRARQAAGKSELLALWHSEIFPAYRTSMFHIVAASSDIQVRVERELRDLVGKEDANALLSNLSGPSAKLESMGPMAGLGMVLRGEMSRAAYLENYGHRGLNEGECAWPRPAEDPLWLDRQLEEWKKTPVDIEMLMTRQRTAYTAAWDRFQKKFPRKVKYMQKRLAQVARSTQQRELVRSEGTRGMMVMRAFALHAGEMLEIGEGVFFLTIDEVLSALAGETSAIQYIHTRQEIYQRYRALPPYPAIICGRFDPLSWAADPNRRNDIFDAGTRIIPAPDT
ncbi:MAG: hypothetical protein IH586_11695, partial [Anaerolineaceae bacterium]|nr:hypothetical protein [Anaerolineaceae bacterium]